MGESGKRSRRKKRAEERKLNGVGADKWVYKREMNQTREERDKLVSKHRRQRADQGYSWEDWINFDDFLAGILANALRDFLKDGHGYPMGMTEEAWNEQLTVAERAMRDYSKKDESLDPDVRKKAVEDAKQAMHWVADNLPSLWD